MTSSPPELCARPAVGDWTGAEQVHKAPLQRVLQGQTGNSRVTGMEKARLQEWLWEGGPNHLAKLRPSLKLCYPTVATNHVAT